MDVLCFAHLEVYVEPLAITEIEDEEKVEVEKERRSSVSSSSSSSTEKQSKKEAKERKPSNGQTRSSKATPDHAPAVERRHSEAGKKLLQMKVENDRLRKDRTDALRQQKVPQMLVFSLLQPMQMAGG